MLTIYHWEPNANSGKPMLAALEKGVEFESRYIDMLSFEQHAPAYLQVNPNGTIPGMIHDGVLVLREEWRRVLTDGYSDELIEDSKRKIALAVRRFEETLANSHWLVSSTYSLADIDAFSICNSLPTLVPGLVSEAAAPRLMDWLNRIRMRPAVRAALAVSRTGKPELAFAPGPEHSRWG
jgi:glutathione S-transferase